MQQIGQCTVVYLLIKSNIRLKKSEIVSLQADEGEDIAKDVAKLKDELEEHQKVLDNELEKNQQKINEELDIINGRLREAIEKAKNEAIKSGRCCTVS